MKKCFLIATALISLLAFSAAAQNNKEIKQQAEQIGYLKIYGELIKKGYEIAKAGLNLIGDIKNKDFLQHKNYFKSLATVNSMVRNSPEAARITALGRQVMIVYYRDWAKVRASDRFSDSEKEYVYGVYQRVIKNSQAELDQLEALLTDDKLVMKDGERLESLSRVLGQMEDNYDFISRFSSQTLMLDGSRKRSRQQAGLLNELLNLEEP